MREPRPIRGLSTAAALVLGALGLGTPAGAALGPGDTTGLALEFDGETRTYDVHVPASYTGASPVPLVLDFHGWSLSGAQQQSFSGFASLSESEGFIVAFPDGFEVPGGPPPPGPGGSNRSWNAGICCDPALAAGLDDVGLARAIVEDVASQANVDLRRVYATGHSNGAGLAHRIACEASDRFAAVSAVAAPLFVDPLTACAPARAMPVLHFAGLTDVVVPYAGGTSSEFPTLTVPSAAASFGRWATVGGCTDTPTVESFPATGGSCETHLVCADGVRVGLCSLHATDAQGHFTYSNTEGVDVAQRSWDFFSLFTAPPGCGDAIVDAGEGCDDGNQAAGDGCDPTCVVESGCLCTGSPSACECVTSVPIAGTKLVVVDKEAVASKAKLVFVAKDPAITKGAGTDAAAIAASLDVAYDAEAGGFTLDAGVLAGWITNKASVAKFVNKSAPGGSTQAKVAVIKPGKVLKLVAKGLGDEKLDILAAGAPGGDVTVVFGVDNDGEAFRHCTAFPTCVHKPIAAGMGAKLVCKNGMPADCPSPASPSGAFVD